MPSRCVLILLDGLGDRAFSYLDHKTPLQAASTPNLDTLAARGANGLYHAYRPGVALPSEDAHFALFGYEREDFPGRGILEALGGGIEVSGQDVAILAHLISAHVEGGSLIVARKQPQAEPEEVAELFREVAFFESQGIQFHLEPTYGLNGILVLKGPVSPYITDTDPMQRGEPLIDVKPWRKWEEDPVTQHTARTFKEYLIWCHDRLEAHPLNQARALRGAMPANALATQRPGHLRAVEPFAARWGLRGLSISSGLVYQGLCSFLGMTAYKAKDTDDVGADLAERVLWALESLEEYDFIHVHTKAPDTAAHTKDPMIKLAAIEALDRGLGRVLDPLLANPEVLVVVTSDHSTPSSGPLVHSGEPVPMVFVGEGVRRDDVRHFDEIHCAGGALGPVRGTEFMSLVLNHLDRAKLRGIMDTPDDQPFWPGPREPFRIR